MIWQLVKRDPAWRIALKCVPVAAVAGLALPREAMGMFSWLVWMPWLQCQPQRRATGFEAALPIRACDLFLARLLSFLASLWLPMATFAVVLLLAGRPVADAVLVMELGAGGSMLVLLALSSRVREIAGSQWAPAISLAIVCAAAWPAWRFLPPAAVLALCAVLSAGLFGNIWRQLPPAFEVLPAKCAPQGSSRRGGAAPALVWWPVMRALFPPRVLFFLPMILVQLISGQWMYGTAMCMFPIFAALSHTSWVQGLPIRRGGLLAVVVLPCIGPLLLGTFLSSLVEQRTPIQFVKIKDHNTSSLRPPMEFWHVAPQGRAPLIQAPWRESWQPETMRLGGITLYNPYSMGPDNSRRFFEWQYLRATEAVYGQAVAFTDRKRLESLRPFDRQARFVVLNLAACACWIMLLANLVLSALHWRVRRVFEHGVSALTWIIVAQMACVILIEMAISKQGFGRYGAVLVNTLLLRLSAALPASLPLTALAAAFPAVLLCWTAARLFRGAELPPPAAIAQG